MDAKRLGVPILVVDALTSGEPRSYPYLGNLPTIHWSGAAPEIESRRIVSRAVRETLRFMHNRALLDGLKQDADVVLATAPEALTLAWDADEASPEKLFLYPDPPLSKQELAVLHTLRPSAKFTTPLSRVAEEPILGEPAAVAVSISASDDLARHGLAPEHQDTLSDEIHLYLLLAGLQIAYGGALSGGFADASNFTLRLFELVRSYSKLAEHIGRRDLQPILNHAPWPLHLGYGDREYNLFGQVAKLIKGPQPPKSEVPEEEADLFPPGAGFRFQSDTPAQRLAWTRGLTAMRRQMTDGVQARIAIGGRLNQYASLYPGIVEEAWMSLVRRQPLYLVGAFGGAADVEIVGIRVRPERFGPRLYRQGTRPVLRGTFWPFTETSGYLFASGFKPRLGTYDGWESPVPLKIDIQQGDAELELVARDILGLTKLNYNACTLGDSQPVTIGFSDAVGEILVNNPTIAGRRQDVDHRFRYYI